MCTIFSFCSFLQYRSGMVLFLNLSGNWKELAEQIHVPLMSCLVMFWWCKSPGQQHAWWPNLFRMFWGAFQKCLQALNSKSFGIFIWSALTMELRLFCIKPLILYLTVMKQDAFVIYVKMFLDNYSYHPYNLSCFLKTEVAIIIEICIHCSP